MPREKKSTEAGCSIGFVPKLCSQGTYTQSLLQLVDAGGVFFCLLIYVSGASHGMVVTPPTRLAGADCEPVLHVLVCGTYCPPVITPNTRKTLVGFDYEYAYVLINQCSNCTVNPC